MMCIFLDFPDITVAVAASAAWRPQKYAAYYNTSGSVMLWKYYTKEETVCTVPYAGNCQCDRKNTGKSKERLAFWGGIWYAI